MKFVQLKSLALIFLGLSLFAFPAWAAVSTAGLPQRTGFDWKSDWAVKDGFAIQIDTEGYQFPTAIAFVPYPGNGPKDPLYFVTELRGKVKVVTNDRTVYTFAEEFFQLSPREELPSIEGEVGLAGICLAAEQGYVFVTFAYQDAGGILRNNTVRFETIPEIFAIQPTSQLAFTEIFSAYEAVPSHQIGPCQVSGDSLYVSIADGRQTEQSQKIDSLLGKVLRMTLDGKPAPGNPFYQDDDLHKAANYVWAYGFRNPFGLKVVGDRVLVADNGHNVDRFLEVEPGENYLWDGSDWSIGTRAQAILTPAVGPAQLDYNRPGSAALPPEYQGSFFLALSAPQAAGVLQLGYGLEEKKMLSTPEYFLEYRGKEEQVVAGVGIGPDGLYFIPIMPDQEGRSAVFRISYDPEQRHPFSLLTNEDPESLMREKGCFGCHSLNNEGGSAGPALDRGPMLKRIQARLNSDAYLRSLQEIDQLDQEPFAAYQEARAELAQTKGIERARTWMKYHIIEPRFDDPQAQMPNLGLSEAEAALITDYLLPQEESLLQKAQAALIGFLPAQIFPRHLLLFFGVGFILGILFLALSSWLWVKIKQRRPKRAKLVNDSR